VFTKQISPKK